MQEFNELREVVDKLLDKGVGDYINLPQIAVMGDTSSGKSSLLSMISGVVFPSTADLTTRCPTRLHMSRGDKVSARIRIQWHSSSTYRIDENDAKGFKERQVETLEDITAAIADAQAFIIERAKLDVTRDVIEVTVRSPNSVDLTLIDLPGIVRTHGKGESSTLGDDIMSLMQDYLKNPRCIVLAVVPANVDFHNSQIMSDALKVDPETTRTIPIITKPDLIDKGSEGSVLDLLLGKKTQDFMLGFHIVKGRGQAALDKGDTVKKGLADEETYFRLTEPWNTVDPYLKGVHALRTKLASIQVRMLESEVPRIRAEISARRLAAEEKLLALGDHFPSLGQKRMAFSRIVDSLRLIILQAESGYSGDSGVPPFFAKDGYTLRASIEASFVDFNERMLSTKLATMSDIVDGTHVIAAIDGKEYKGTVYEKMNDEEFAIEPNNSDDAEVFYDDEGAHKPIASTQLTVDHSKWLLERIVRTKSRDLSIFPSAAVFNAIIKEAVARDWEPLATDLLKVVATMVRECIIFSLDAALKTSQNVAKRVQAYLSDRLESIIKECLENGCRYEILDCIEKEKCPSTQNHYLTENVSRARLAPLLKLIDSGAESKDIKAYILCAQKKSIDAFVAEDLQNSLSGYGKVAAKRFIDVVIETINKALMKISPRVGELFFEVDDGELEKLMSEPSDTAEKRKRLEREIKAMEEAETAIKTLL